MSCRCGIKGKNLKKDKINCPSSEIKEKKDN